MHSETAQTDSTLTDLEDKSIIREQGKKDVLTEDLNDARFLPIALKNVTSLAKSSGYYFVTERADGHSTPLMIKETAKAINIFNTIRWVVRFMLHGSNHQLLSLNPYLSKFYESVAPLTPYLMSSLSNYRHDEARDVMKRLNAAIAHFRIATKSDAFKVTLKAYLRNIHKNGKSFSRYVDQLFDCHAKLLLVRIDVGYGNEMKGLVTYQGAKVHRNQLVKYVKQRYEDLLGYVWKLEYTPQKGYHYHLLFLFNGNRVMRDISIAGSIGYYWINEITQGGGTYFNCNLGKLRRYGDKLGIGMIKRNDEKHRGNIQYVINYLVKTDLYIKASVPVGVRTFGKGEIIKKRVKK